MNKLLKLLLGAQTKRKCHSENRSPWVWLFGEWFGQRCCDNSMYLANYISENHPEIEIYWAAQEGTDLSRLRQDIRQVLFETKEAMIVYKKAGVVFMGQGFKDFSKEGFNYFSGAVTVNLWHGVMWKHVGHGGSNRRGCIYNLYIKVFDDIYGANCYVATSENYAKICETAFGAKPTQIIRSGYPRNSIFYQPEEVEGARMQVIAMLSKKTGIQWSEDTKIITYMPTFRDTIENTFSFEELTEDDEFWEWLEVNNVIILQKAHFVTQQRHKEESFEEQRHVFIFNDVSAQMLLAATDLLITDYSGCFFDFLLLDRPIIHFVYDYDYYMNQDRGLYYEKEEVVCGDVAMEKSELRSFIIENMENPQKQHALRVSRRKKFMTYDTPDSCEVIYKAVQKRLEK